MPVFVVAHCEQAIVEKKKHSFRGSPWTRSTDPSRATTGNVQLQASNLQQLLGLWLEKASQWGRWQDVKGGTRSTRLPEVEPPQPLRRDLPTSCLANGEQRRDLRSLARGELQTLVHINFSRPTGAGEFSCLVQTSLFLLWVSRSWEKKKRALLPLHSAPHSNSIYPSSPRSRPPSAPAVPSHHGAQEPHHYRHGPRCAPLSAE